MAAQACETKMCGGTHSPALFGQHGRPVVVGFADVAGNIPLPVALHLRVVIQVELAVDNFPMLRIALGGVAVGHCPSAVTAVLRRIGLGLCLECIPVVLVGKTPSGPLPG